MNKPQGDMNANQSFTSLQKNNNKKKGGNYINQKPLKRFPAQFLKTCGALQMEDSHWLGLCWVAVSAGISRLPRQYGQSL